jgi:S-adenosylmethionine:tRNA ribosyltransferase-isomerase
LDRLDICDYDYALPDVRIAKYPLEHRDRSKLLIYQRGKVSEDRFKNLPDYLPLHSDLYLNNTRVIHARLKFRRKSGAAIEVFCLAPCEPADYQLAFSAERSCTWKCMVGNLGKWKNDTLELNIMLHDTAVILTAKKLKVEGGAVRVHFSWNGSFTFGQIVKHAGTIPIPPYLNREAENIDKERYQTVYSKPEGSVAAPTAGLHFTPDMFDKLHQKQIRTYEITLHVGAGTFQPVKNNNALDHSMHSEFFSIDRKIIEQLAISESPVIAAGTTTLRALESLYWLAVKSTINDRICTTLDQWEHDGLPSDHTAKQAFNHLHRLMLKQGIKQFNAKTSIMIVPGYKFRVINGLITNFHQPKSTLLLLVAAFIGDDWKKVYEYALSHEFRFLSYGDSSLLLKEISRLSI